MVQLKISFQNTTNISVDNLGIVLCIIHLTEGMHKGPQMSTLAARVECHQHHLLNKKRVIYACLCVNVFFIIPCLEEYGE